MNRELLAAFDAALQQLITLLPVVHRAVAGLRPLDTDPRWALLRHNAEDLAQRKLPVVTLLGPSGSGKSTIFRLLTGLDVPAGSAERPMSYNCMLAVPPGLDRATLDAMFPSMHLQPLEAPEAIKRRDLPRETLFFREMPPHVAAQGDFLLADVPDFNTTCLENWEKAKLMLQRAEVVLFVVTRISYADYQTMLYLARACAHAGHLAYVLTMADAAVARSIWTDLSERKAPEFALRADLPADDEPRPFSEKRADHLTRAEFLAQADVYHSPYSEQPQLADIHALREGAPALADFLRGRNIARLMLTKRANDLQQGLKLADETLASHAAQLADLRRRHAQIETQLADEELDIVERQLPLGEILEEVFAQAQTELPYWRRAIAAITDPIWRGMKLVYSKIREFLSRPEQARAVRRDEVELAALVTQASHLADKWRADHGPAIDLTAERCSAILAALRTSTPPEPDQEWKQFAAEKARAWVQAHPHKATLLLNAGGVIALLAGSLVTFDLATTGGLIHVGLAKGLAAGVLGTSVLTVGVNSLVKKLGLDPVLLEFQVEWKRQRNRQLRVHLRDAFARPLVLETLERRLAALENAPAAACAQTVAELRRRLTETQA